MVKLLLDDDKPLVWKNGKTHKLTYKNTTAPAKINIEPENDGLEDDFPLPGVSCQVPC